MTPEERSYWGAMQDVGNARLRRASGAQINRQEYEREIRPLVPLAGEGSENVSEKQRRREQAGRLYIRGAKRQFTPDILSPRARAIWQSWHDGEVPGVPEDGVSEDDITDFDKR
jgi:hypothetical protein